MLRDTKMKGKLIILIILIVTLLISGCNSTSFNSEHQSECQKVCINEELQLRIVQHSGNNNIICNCEKIIVHEIGEKR